MAVPYINASCVDSCSNFCKMLQICFILVLCSFCYGQLPSYIKPCKKDANLGDCIKKNIEAVKPHMGKGVPELYLEPLSPWVYPSIKMSTPFLRFDVYDARVWKMDTAVVKDVKINLDEGIINVEYNIPYFWGESTYDMDGNLFMFQVNNKGYSNGSITDVDITLGFRAKPKEVNGKNYMDVEKSSFSWNIKGGATIYFRDIYPGNPFLSNSFNEELSSRSVEFFYMAQPTIEFMLTDWIEKSVKGVFSNYSLEELFVK